MDDENTISSSNQIITYIYDLSMALSNTCAELSSTSDKDEISNKIKSTITSTYVADNTVARNIELIIQVSPVVNDLKLYDRNFEVIKNYENGRYKIRTGADGKAIIYFSSNTNTYAIVTISAEQNSTSIATPHILFFGGYTNTPSPIPAPVITLNDNNQFDIPTNTAYFHVKIPTTEMPIVPANASCVIIVNNFHFMKQNFIAALVNGIEIPSAYLVTETDNEIAYFIQDNTSNEILISPKITFKATGTPCIHPEQSTGHSRTLQSRPYLNYGQTSITPNNALNLKVCLDKKIEAENKYTYDTGDVYEIGRVKVLDSETTTIIMEIPSDKLSGYGANTNNSPGRYELDYTVKHSNDETTYTLQLAKNILKGNITTII
jgi:hypothetical protein